MTISKITKKNFSIFLKTGAKIVDGDIISDSGKNKGHYHFVKMEDYNVFVHSNKDSKDSGAPLAFASFCDDYPNREWTIFHI